MNFEAVREFCYLGDMLSAGGGCELAAITPCKCALGKDQLLPLLSSYQPQPAGSGPRLGVLIMLEECDAVCSRNLGHDDGKLNRLQCNDCAMICWICNVKAKDEVRKRV